MVFNDDELIVPTPYDSGSTQETFIQEKTKLTITKKEKVPLEETNLTVFLELTGNNGFKSQRKGVDIVAVVDLSQSQNLKKVKNAIHFLISKLSSTDRLSVIWLSDLSTRLCPLTQMTKISASEIAKMVDEVDNLGAFDGTKVVDGLEMAAKVLADRRHCHGRVGVIMVMSDHSDGVANWGSDRVGPVYTFGFGDDDCDHKGLEAISENTGGLFTNANVENTPLSNLSTMFSNSLSRILKEDVKNLELTIEQHNNNSSIKKVNAGSYPRSNNVDDVESTTIIFGNLYKQEIINLSVDLLLPAVSVDNKMEDVFQITISYSVGENRLDTSPILVSMTRKSQVFHQDTDEELSDLEEEVSRLTVSSNTNDQTKELVVEKMNQFVGFGVKVKEAGVNYFGTKMYGFNDILGRKQEMTKEEDPEEFVDADMNEPNDNLGHKQEIIVEEIHKEVLVAPEKTKYIGFGERFKGMGFQNFGVKMQEVVDISGLKQQTMEEENKFSSNIQEELVDANKHEPNDNKQEIKVEEINQVTLEKTKYIGFGEGFKGIGFQNFGANKMQELVDISRLKQETMEDENKFGFDDKLVSQSPNVMNLAKQSNSITTIINCEMPTSMDLLHKHLMEAIQSIQTMQDELNKFL